MMQHIWIQETGNPKKEQNYSVDGQLGAACNDREKNGENLKKYRGEKLSKGRKSIRRKRYAYQPHDIVNYQNHKYVVKGIQNLGAYIKLADLNTPVKTQSVEPYKFGKGFCIQPKDYL